MDHKHLSQQHLPASIQDEGSRESHIEVEEEARCFACEEGIEGLPSSSCNGGGKLYLHKSCLEIKHPFHPQHPLVLLSKSPYNHENFCNFCRRRIVPGLAYHCSSDCGFDLDIDCARLQLSITGNFHKLEHPLHKHPLIFNEKHNKKKKGCCEACRGYLKNSIYRCLESSCSFDLHKECAELPSKLVNHPFHPLHHLLTPLEPLPYPKKRNCFLCHWDFGGFSYGCNACEFQLDTRCARLQVSVAESYPKHEHSLHEHPLILIDNNHVKTVKGDCFGCRKPLSLPIYKCLHCINFDLHEKCAQLPLEIDHPNDRKHPLALLQNPPTHPVGCSCYLCLIQWKGFVYYCSICKFGLTPEDVSSLPKIEAETHEHPWILISRPMSFICDFCGTFGDRTPYLCTTCNLIVHKNCTSLPLSLATTQHQHPISHSYYLRGNQIEEMKCKICYKEVDTRYGSYSCSASDCNYIAHVKCATDSKIWGGETGDVRFEGESMIDVIEEENLGEGVIATKIKHAYHNKHELILTLSDEDARCYGNCGACMKPISAPDPVYGCSQCGRFFLHKSCAELPRKKRHPSHKHPLVLRKNASCCTACNRFHHGFNYKCDRRSCEFVLDVQCSSLSHILEHPSHEHRLFLDHNYHGNCNGCGNEIRSSSSGPSLGYKCVEGCPFALDFSCLTLPLEAWFKYEEKHPLTLTYNDGSDPNQCYCDICEEERDPKQWFYCCENCDTTLHRDCILGDLPLVKLGERLKIAEHKHPVTFVKKIWNCPPCDVCRKLCNLQALECGEPKCNFIIHWKCHGAASTYGRVPKYFPVKVRRKDWMFSLMEYQVSHNLTDCSYIEHVKYATDNNICGRET